jgi:signal transduction histidine kinase
MPRKAIQAELAYFKKFLALIPRSTYAKDLQHITPNQDLKSHVLTTEFLSQTSHDLRNLLSTVMLLHAELKNAAHNLQDHLSVIQEPTENTAVHQYFQTIYDSCQLAQAETQRALTALENLVELHQLQLEPPKPDWQPIQIQTLLEDTIEKIASIPSVEIQHTIDQTVPISVCIDYANVLEALHIFTHNALRFSKKGARIKLSIGEKQTPIGTQLSIAIQDFGVGMTKSQLENLKAKLNGTPNHSREDLYRMPAVQLTRAKLLLAASGSAFTINSIPDQGTVICIECPYQ